jgi:hypothetical protein
MRQGTYAIEITVVPDSGTGELLGISGAMRSSSKEASTRGPLVLYQNNGSPLTGFGSGVRPSGGAEDGSVQQRTAHAPLHVLFASDDARRAGTRDSGIGRESGAHDDAAVHAPQSRGARQSDWLLK